MDHGHGLWAARGAGLANVRPTSGSGRDGVVLLTRGVLARSRTSVARLLGAVHEAIEMDELEQPHHLGSHVTVDLQLPALDLGVAYRANQQVQAGGVHELEFRQIESDRRLERPQASQPGFKDGNRAEIQLAGQLQPQAVIVVSLVDSERGWRSRRLCPSRLTS